MRYICICCEAAGADGKHYRMVLSCGCGVYGPVNYDDGHRIGYYCGSTERRIP